MKKNVIFFAVSIAFVVLMISCSEEKVTQRIMGAGDCQSCSGWSWSNGVASTTVNNSDALHSFSFKSKVSGEFTFSHQMMPIYGSTYSNSLLQVSIGGKLYFQISTGDGGTATFSKSSIGSVKEGEVIIFTGRRFYVKDIKIEGTASGSQGGDNGNPDNPQWDF